MTHISPQKESTRLRREQSRERLLLAAEDQLREEELEDFSIRNIVERANESVGTFYRVFPSKESLLRTVQHRLYERVHPSILGGLKAEESRGESLEEAVERAFSIVIEHAMAERELFRAFILFGPLDSELRRNSRQQQLKLRDALTSVLQKHRAEINHPDPDQAIHHAYHIYLSTMTGRLVLVRPGIGPVFGVGNDVFFAQLKLSIRNFLCGTNGCKPPG